MTFEKVLNDLQFNHITLQDAYDAVSKKDSLKTINYYVHHDEITKDQLSDSQLQELNAIVGILQILYNSQYDSPIPDSQYDILQEMLVNMGIPRLTGTIEINSDTKVNHKYTQLRGTLDKVYYLTPDERRVNKSRKYLDEWIRSTEDLYERNTGENINLNKVKVMLQPKFDGCSTILEVDKKFRWITRGDTSKNLASDVSHIMKVFNNLYMDENIGTGIKFEVMVTEENKDKINDLYRIKRYRNSRQIVTATLNANEPDFKVDYLYPVPLRIIHEGDVVESVHPDLIKNFPTEICLLGDRERIRNFANNHRYVYHNGMRFRTDGVVITILSEKIKEALGRDNNINNFEVAYKFTEECAYTKVKDVEFYLSDMNYITPVLVVNDVILKGNTINHISLSNKERFDELDLHYGDEVKVLYDIIPYVTIDDQCRRMKNGRKIKFINRCPRCGAELDLDNVQIRCNNPKCPSRIIGRMMNYCSTLRIQNIGYQTLDMLYTLGFLDDGIRDLYKLKKKAYEIEELEGFGKAKTKKIISEIEAKRKLNDYDFFGAIGIDTWNVKSFQLLFSNIKLSEFMDMIKLKNFDLLKAKLLAIPKIGDVKANILIWYLKDKNNEKEINKLLKEVSLNQTYGILEATKGRIVFSGCRPPMETAQLLINNKWNPSDTWSEKDTKMLVIPNDNYTSNKVDKAIAKGIPIIALNGRSILEALQIYI